MSKERAGEAWALSKFHTSPTPFFFICSPITLYVCVFVRPSVMLVEIRVVSACLSLCLSISLPACLRACLYAVQNSINAGQIFT